MSGVRSTDATLRVVGSRRNRWSLGGGLMAAALLAAPTASAQDVTAAATAFSAGQQAELAREWGRAAEFYSLADRISPSPEALRSMAKSYLAGGDRANAATQAEELVRRYPNDAASTSLAGVILQQVGSRLTRWEVHCRPSCTVGADSAAISTEPRSDHVIYVDPGEHRLVAYFAGNRSTSRSVVGEEGARQQITFEPPSQPPSPGDAHLGRASASPAAEPTSSERSGLSPAVVIAGAAVTVVLGAITVWSGLDTLSARDDYVGHPTRTGYDDGVGREHRTNWLLGATAVAGVATVAVGAFGVRWTSTSRGGAASVKPRSWGLLAHPAGGVLLEGSF